jgi:hypothetical protein
MLFIINRVRCQLKSYKKNDFLFSISNAIRSYIVHKSNSKKSSLYNIKYILLYL